MTRDAAGSPGQLPLQLPHDAALGRADFIIGRSNHAAIDVLDRWPQWPERGVLLVGPAGSGKSHLAEIWRATSAAIRIDASALDQGTPVRVRPNAAIAVEDLHTERLDEAALFHLVNAAAEQGVSLLMT
ncbi:MAG: hypothetical protein GY798_22305, partial [Hyphomicrobiales bacterium]|nr:hypothetical protein [Hyphomicrobiales bacterium]